LWSAFAFLVQRESTREKSGAKTIRRQKKCPVSAEKARINEEQEKMPERKKRKDGRRERKRLGRREGRAEDETSKAEKMKGWKTEAAHGRRGINDDVIDLA